MEVSSHVRWSKTVLNPWIEQLFGIFLSNVLAFSEQNLERPILDSTPRIPDCSYWIPVFAMGTWILDSNRLWDSGFLELYSEFQGPAKFSRIPEFGFPYVAWGDTKGLHCKYTGELHTIPYNFVIRNCMELSRRLFLISLGAADFVTYDQHEVFLPTPFCQENVII